MEGSGTRSQGDTYSLWSAPLKRITLINSDEHPSLNRGGYYNLQKRYNLLILNMDFVFKCIFHDGEDQAYATKSPGRFCRCHQLIETLYIRGKNGVGGTRTE